MSLGKVHKITQTLNFENPILHHSHLSLDLTRASTTAPGGGSATTRAGSQDVVDEGGGGEDGVGGTECSSVVSGGGWSRVSRSHLISYSSVDDESFVSAQDTIADLKDFEDFEMAGGEYL